MKIFIPKNYNVVFYLLVVLLFSSYIFLGLKNDTEKTESAKGQSVTINNSIIEIEIADEPSEYWKGLSGKPILGENNGMLFIFEQKQEKSFWMKDMNFPIDIIWINDNKVVSIHKDLLPEGELPENKYKSEAPVNYVLEVNSGYAEKHDIKVGDTIEYNF